MSDQETSPYLKSPKALLGARVLIIAGMFILSIGLAWISNTQSQTASGFQGWGAFMVVNLIGGLLLYGAWWSLKSENLPKVLFLLLVGAALLRLVTAVFWFVAMPRWGHDTPVEQAGYIMADAGTRDQAAWELAQSNQPLWTAFRGNRQVDQYGGLLFFSALVYRYLDAAGLSHQHQPLLMATFCAAFSALGVLFTWAFARRAWDESIAWLAASILTIYPEAVLLGSSQMREAFMITLTASAFYGLIRYHQEHSWIGLGWILGSLLLFTPLSPPFAALLTGMLVLVWLASALPQRWGFLKQRRMVLVLSLLLIFVLVGTWIVLKQFTPPDMNNPFAMMNWYVRKSANLQAYLTEHISGWIQKIFDNTPAWTHLPLLLGYGIVRPFLPAAIVARSESVVWTWITIWRSIGWTFLLVVLLYAPLVAIQKRGKNNFVSILILIVWISILLASFRGGADQWDNPRYRAVFASLQISLVAWVWIEERRHGGVWLRRALISAAAITAWLLSWYLQRIPGVNWPVSDPFKALGLGIASACLLLFWDWACSRRRGESADTPEGQIKQNK